MDNDSPPRRRLAKRMHAADSDDELTPPTSPSQSLPAKRLRPQSSASHHSANESDDDYAAREASPISSLSSLSASPEASHGKKGRAKRAQAGEPGKSPKKKGPGGRKGAGSQPAQSTPDAQVASQETSSAVVEEVASPLQDSAAKSHSQTDQTSVKKKLGPIPKKPNASSSSTPNRAAGASRSLKPQASIVGRPGEGEDATSLRLGAKAGVKTATKDYDLRDGDVYKALFGLAKSSIKSTSTPTGRAGLAEVGQREKDAIRRAELASRREEEKAQRLREATGADQLYEQNFRIAKFEERMRARHSQAGVGPHVFAAALRTI